MPIAEIITIGTELLLGEIQDTNTGFIARALRDAGIDLFRTMTVGDNSQRIAQAIQEAMQRADILVTTGGLGPTVDDPTRQAVADAVRVPLEFQPHLWEQIQNRFKRFGRDATDNNRRQAFIPAGSLAIENPVGTAPAFIVERDLKSIISLPGVPREMEFLLENVVLPYLRRRYDLKGTIKSTVLHVASLGESQVDEVIGDLETLSNPTVGMLAHAGIVDIRVAAKAGSQEAADQLIVGVSTEIQKRLGDHIFGQNHQTLEQVVFSLLEQTGKSVYVIENGVQGKLLARIGGLFGQCLGGEALPGRVEPSDLRVIAQETRLSKEADFVLALGLYPGSEKQEMYLFLVEPAQVKELNRTYGGPPSMAFDWAVNNSLDFFRRHLLSDSQSPHEKSANG